MTTRHTGQQSPFDAAGFAAALLKEQRRAESFGCALSVQDLYKAAFQAAMGCGHLIADEKLARARFMEEWNFDAEENSPCFTPLSAGFCRMHLPAMRKQGYAADFCFELFKNSAAIPGDSALLEEYARMAQEFFGSLYGPAAQEKAKAAWQQWKTAGRPLFSHTDEYREKLRPNYRVVEAGCMEAAALLYRIWQLGQKAAAEGKGAGVAIDGRCGAGKSTLAALCGRMLGFPVAHMDDFFLPFELRSPQRLAQPGGNLHYERAQKQLLCHIGRGHAFAYPVFSCQTGGFDGLRKLPAAPVVIVEGSYSHHPAFGDVWDLRVFCDVEKQLQKQRILARNGEMMWKNFEERWIPMEEAYFAAFSVQKASDIILRPGSNEET